jgi:hypothetical protein
LGAQEAVPHRLFSSLYTGQGNHRESSPFLCPLEASRGSDYYDRNLALFEVTKEPFWATGVAGRWAGRVMPGASQLTSQTEVPLALPTEAAFPEATNNPSPICYL